MVLETYVKLCVTEPDFLKKKKILSQKLGKWTKNDFLHVDKNSHKLKVNQKFLGWEWSKMGVASLVRGL